jgi:hypothetical protein
VARQVAVLPYRQHLDERREEVIRQIEVSVALVLLDCPADANCAPVLIEVTDLRRLEAQKPAARTFVGLVLLFAGFLLQIGAYVADGTCWLALLVIGVGLIGLVLGRLLSDGLLAPWLYRRAARYRASEDR